MSRTPLTAKTAVNLACNLGKVVPKLGLTEEEATHWNTHLEKLHRSIRDVLLHGNWLDRLVQAENDAHRAFFGKTFYLAQFAQTLERLGEDCISRWAKLGLEPHFLPKFQFQPGIELPGWRVRPQEWFWQQVAAGNIKRRNAAGKLETVKEVGFDGTTVLIDARCKPMYDGGRQMFANDECFLGELIEKLRAEGKIAPYEYGPQSRFGISSREWDEQICPALEARPEFKDVRFRLELAIEANTIPLIYNGMPRREDGQTDIRVGYEEFFEDELSRLCGGFSDDGGLAFVRCIGVDYRWHRQAVRPLGVLDARSV